MVEAKPHVDFVIRTSVLSIADITSSLGVVPDAAETDSDESSIWRLRVDTGVLFSGFDEPMYLMSLQINRIWKRLTPMQDKLVSLNRRLRDEEPWRPHMYLEVVPSTNDPHFAVYEDVLAFLGAVGIRLIVSNEPHKSLDD